MPIQLRANRIYFTGEIRKWIIENRFRYTTIDISSDYSTIVMRFYTTEVPRSYMITVTPNYVTVTCRKLADLAEKGIEIIDYVIIPSENMLVIRTSVQRKEEVLSFERIEKPQPRVSIRAIPQVALYPDCIRFYREIHKWIVENRFSYARVYSTKDYSAIRIEFYTVPVPESYRVVISKSDSAIFCRALASRLYEKNIKIVDYEISRNILTLYTTAEQKYPKEFESVRRRHVTEEKKGKEKKEKIFTVSEYGLIYFIGNIRKWILENNFRCVEVYAEEARIPMYLEFHFYREEECRPDMARVIIHPVTKGVFISAHALAEYLNQFKLIPREYEIVGNVLRVWLTFKV